MKRIICVMLTLCLLASLLTGCGAAEQREENGKPSVVVTIYPVYDWVKHLLGERAERFELRLLLDEGVDMHSFQPSVQDMVAIADCDLLIYVGGESDDWIDTVEANHPNQRRFSLLEQLGETALEEELVEGMQGEADGAPDEHVWLSPKRARILCAALLPALEALDPEGSRYLQASQKAYDAELEALDRDYEAVVTAASGRSLLVADRFPFRYLAEDYGLTYYAAFPGCEAETEASFQTVSILAGKLDELGLKTVLVIESGDGRLAETVIAASRDKDQTVRVLHSMQGPSGGRDYLTIMRDDLEVLKEALGLKMNFLENKENEKAPQIVCEGLSLGYEGTPLLRDLSFSVREGDYLCIVGENGSGKSTLMKTLLGLQPPLAGRVELCGGLKATEIGYLPQQTEIQRDFPASVREIVLSGCQGRLGLRPFYGRDEKALAAGSMEKLGITELAARCYRELSGGQQQRVLLARALCATRRILLLDEPVSGLDPKATAEMYELIESLNREGITIIMISHDMHYALRRASHILQIGRDWFYGSKADYLRSPVGRNYLRAGREAAL